MGLRAKLKERAEKRLVVVVDESAEAIAKILEDTGISVFEVAKILSSHRSETIRGKLIRRMATRFEDEMIEEFNKQQDLL